MMQVFSTHAGIVLTRARIIDEFDSIDFSDFIKLCPQHGSDQGARQFPRPPASQRWSDAIRGLHGHVICRIEGAHAG